MITTDPLVTTNMPEGRRGMTMLVPSDLFRVKSLHDTVLREPRTAELYVSRDVRFFARHLGWAGRVLGFFDGAGSLAAYSVLGLPAADAPDNIGWMIGMPPEERARVAHLDGTAIRPDWRGQGLQRRFTAERIAMAYSHGKPVLLATCQPDNDWSLANLLKMGLVVVAFRSKFDKPRLILRRDLDRSRASIAPRPGPRVASDDFAGHRRALAEGWFGTAALRDTSGTLTIVYDAIQTGCLS